MGQFVSTGLNVTMLLLLAAAAAGWLLYRVRYHLRQYGYDVRVDRPCHAFVKTEVSFETLPDGFVVGECGADMLLVAEVDVSASPWGFVRLPSVELEMAGKRSAHFFEHGAKGRRCLPVGPCEEGQAVALRRTRGVSRLKVVRLFAVLSSAADDRVMVLSPHPDDAEIAAFGLYSGAKDAAVVTVTAGDGGKRRYREYLPDETSAYRLKADVRVLDSLNVPRLGGVAPERIVNLGYFDGTLEAMFRSPDVPAVSRRSGAAVPAFFRRHNPGGIVDAGREEATWQGLVEDLRSAIRVFTPASIAVPHPYFDGVKDHRFTTRALLEALRLEGYGPVRLLLYTNHLPANELYPYGPSGAAVGLPPVPSDVPEASGLLVLPLDETAQVRKRAALEMMSILRPDLSWTTPAGMVAAGCRALGNLLKGKDKSYFRRAVRADELFFVFEGSPEALEAALFGPGGDA